VRKVRALIKLDVLWRFFKQLHTIWATHSRLQLLGRIIVLFVLFDIVSLHRLDGDFGWHLVTGDYIRAHGIPTHDIFTYTARQFPWIDHEWGNDVIMSVLYGLGGYVLEAAVFAGLWTAALVVAAGRSRLSVLLLAAVAMFPYAGVRAIAWTMVLLAITLCLLRSKNRRVVWLLPLLFIPWANLHAGFVTGLALIAYYGLFEWRPKLFIVAALSVLATFVNVYGPRLYVEVFRTLLDPTLHSQVAEWAPFVFLWGARIFLVAWGAGGVLVEKRTIRSWLRPSIPMLLSAASATRNVPLFVLVAVEECGRYFDTMVGRLRASLAQYPPTRWFVLGAASALFAAVIWAGWSGIWPLNANREATYPVAAVTYLQANGCEGGNIFNDYDYGGYLIWKLPSQPVYIDGRMPSWKAPDGQKYMTKYYNLLDYPGQYQTTFSRYNIRCVLLKHTPRDAPLIDRLIRDHWRTAVNTTVYILLYAPQPQTALPSR